MVHLVGVNIRHGKSSQEIILWTSLKSVYFPLTVLENINAEISARLLPKRHSFFAVMMKDDAVFVTDSWINEIVCLEGNAGEMETIAQNYKFHS